MPVKAVFINYRRADSGGHAGRVRDRLVAWFGPERVFMDVGILGGDDWVTSIERALSRSGALLAIIGPNWATQRLLEPGDRLRQELEAAMALGVEIIPVLVGGARMPDANELPPSLRDLPRRQAVRLSEEGFDDDVGRLIRRLEQLIGPGRARRAEAPRRSPVVGLLSAVVALAILVGVGYVLFQVISAQTGFNARITISPDSGVPGTTVTVTGTDFPSNTDISIWFMGPVTETVSDDQGAFSARFQVPDTPFGGVQEVIASGGAFSDTAQFTIEGG
jgi:hypothetical protein